MNDWEFNGYKVYSNSALTKPGPRVDVPRLWRERWFTLPWRPFQMFHITYPPIPSDDVIMDKLNRALYMHPTTLIRLREALKSREVSSGFEPRIDYLHTHWTKPTFVKMN